MAREMPKAEASGRQNRPSEEQIAKRAYEIFVERGRPEGCDLEHWLEAEAQLNAPASASSSRAPRSSSRRQANGAR